MIAGQEAVALSVPSARGSATARQSMVIPRCRGLVLRMSDEPENLKRLLGEAETEDAEWLNKVFDPSMRKILNSEGHEMDKNNKNDDNGHPKTPNEDSLQELSPADVAKESNFDGESTRILYDLGYDDELIAEIKPKVLEAIMERRLTKPSQGIPDRWLIGSIGSSDEAGANAKNSSSVSSPSRETFKEQVEPDSVPYLSGDYAIQDSDELLKERFRPNTDGRMGELYGTEEGRGGDSFMWKSGIERPQQPRQSTKYGRGVSRPTNEARGRGTRVGSGSGKRDKDKYSQYGDDNDNDYEIGGANDDLINLGITTANPFWPTVEEFQDMLLQESMWRINLVGRWCIPAVKSETKWRSNLYKDLMFFLDEGLGDGFDVVEEETFGEEDDYDDEDYYDEEEEEEEEDEYDIEGKDDDVMSRRSRYQFPSNSGRSYNSNYDGGGGTAGSSQGRGLDRERRMRSGSLQPTKPLASNKGYVKTLVIIILMKKKGKNVGGRARARISTAGNLSVEC